MEQEKVERINYLAKKSKSEGLTDAEKAEQDNLRKEYIASWKCGLKSTLESVYIKEEDGSVTKLKKKCDK